MASPTSMSASTRRKVRAGFTLMELVVVIGIMALLAGVAIPAASKLMDNQTQDETAARMEALAEALQAFGKDNLALPAALGTLIQVPGGTTLPNWRGPYVGSQMQGWSGRVSDITRDNWNRAYTWTPTGAQGDLRSAGLDGTMNNADDLVVTVDIRPILREITRDRMKILNPAIQNYNAAYITTSPLPSTITAMMTRLVTTGYLPASATSLATDAYGSAWIIRANPVTALTSPNVPSGL